MSHREGSNRAAYQSLWKWFFWICWLCLMAIFADVGRDLWLVRLSKGSQPQSSVSTKIRLRAEQRCSSPDVASAENKWAADAYHHRIYMHDSAL